MINYNYFPQCKSDLDTTDSYPKCPKCNITFYRNSKPTACILPVQDRKVLLSKRAIEPFKGTYDVIGGFLEEGEDPKVGAKREAREETGLDIEPTEILGIYMDTYGEGGDHVLNIYYLGKVSGGEMKLDKEVSGLEWVDIDKAPLEGFKSGQEALKEL